MILSPWGLPPPTLSFTAFVGSFIQLAQSISQTRRFVKFIFTHCVL
jgi:hypothetical protein